MSINQSNTSNKRRDDLKQYGKLNEFYIWGAGVYGKKVLDTVRMINDKTHLKYVVRGILDNSYKKRGELLEGFPVLHPDLDSYEREIPVIIATNNNEEVFQSIEKYGYIRNENAFSYDVISRNLPILSALCDCYEEGETGAERINDWEKQIVKEFKCAEQLKNTRANRKRQIDILQEEVGIGGIVHGLWMLYGDNFKKVYEMIGDEDLSYSAVSEEIKTIALMNNQLGIGGSERVVAHLAKMFTAHGYNVIILVESINKEMDYHIEDGIEVIKIDFKLDIGAYSADCIDCLLRHHVDVICHHSGYNPKLNFYLGLGFRIAKIPSVLQLHSEPSYFLKYDDATHKLMYKYYDEIMVLSAHFKGIWKTLGYNTRVIYNPVDIIREKDIDLYKKNGFDENIVNETGRVILWVGRILQEVKQVLDVVDIMKEVIREMPESKLFICGYASSKSDLNTLNNKISDFGFNDNIIITGFVKDMDRYYRMADCFLMTSKLEGFPMVLVEAKQHSLPVVMYDLPDIELMKDTRGTIVVSQGDVNGAAKGIISLLKDSKYRKKMSSDSYDSLDWLRQYDLMAEWEDVFYSAKERVINRELSYPLPVAMTKFFRDNTLPIISIVTVCKDNLPGVIITYESVREQSFQGYEHVFIDGDSSDGTKEFLQEIEDDQHIFLSEPDDGISDAFNKGLDLAKGDYILFLNSGDTFITIDSLEIVSSRLVDGCDIEVFASRIGNRSLPSNMASSAIKEYWDSAMLPHQGTFVRKEIYERVGRFDKNLKLRMDYDFFYRCVKSDIEFHYTEKIITAYAPGGACSNNPIWFSVEGLDVYKRYEPLEFELMYEGILQKHCIIPENDTLYLISPFGLGDTLILASLMKSLQHKFKSNICYFVKRNHEIIMKMYGIEQYEVHEFSQEELSALSSKCHKPVAGELYVAHPRYHNDNSVLSIDKHKGTITGMYKAFFKIDDRITIQAPLFVPKVSNSLSKIMPNVDLNDLILVAPEMTSYTYPGILDEYFKCIIEELADAGESVMVNVTGTIPDLKKNVLRYSISVEDLIAIAARCKKVISARSGLCDAIYWFVKDLDVIYPDRFFYKAYSLEKNYEARKSVKEKIILWKDRLFDKASYSYAIYGLGVVGRCLARILAEEGVPAKFYMDREITYSDDRIPVYAPGDETPSVDVFVVTVRNGWREVVDYLKEKYKKKVIYYKELLSYDLE